MNEENQLNQTQPADTQQTFQSAPTSNPLPGNNNSNKKKIIILIIIVFVLIVGAFGALFTIQTSRANAYLAEAKEFGSSVAVNQLTDALNEFSTGSNGLYKDMYYCKATSSQVLSVADAASEELAVRKQYSDAYNYLKDNLPNEYTTLPLVGGFGKSAEAKKVNATINDLVNGVEQLTGQSDGYGNYAGNEYSQYCLGSLYNLLSSYTAYLPQFANEATLAQYFSDGSTNAQEKLDQLALFESYDVGTPPSGFEQLDNLQSEFIGGVRASLEGLLATEQSNPRDVLYLGNKYTEFASVLNSFDDSIVPEASRQAERYILLDLDKLQTSLNSVKELANTL